MTVTAIGKPVIGKLYLQLGNGQEIDAEISFWNKFSLDSDGNFHIEGKLGHIVSQFGEQKFS